MSIKVELNQKRAINIYPCIMQSKANGTLWLMRNPTEGVALNSVGMGNFCSDLKVSNMQFYHGSITLTQE